PIVPAAVGITVIVVVIVLLSLLT
ncbi:MAG: hypothetical protein QOC64_1775, partial [Solirubrobacteraceae bacterium]|nr:hypothetical protein [Solirubrobacteraceae bacterium]